MFFGCKNSRFGGNGSLLNLHCESTIQSKSHLGYEIIPGVLEQEAISLLRRFVYYTSFILLAHNKKRQSHSNMNYTPIVAFMIGKIFTRQMRKGKESHSSKIFVQGIKDRWILKNDNQEYSDYRLLCFRHFSYFKFLILSFLSSFFSSNLFAFSSRWIVA